MPQSPPLKPDEHSKSKRKEEMLDLQKMGESLIRLTNEQLMTLDLPDNLLSAIQEAKSLKSNEAKRRLLQYIGKLMRHIDLDAIKLALKNVKDVREKSTNEFHLVEEWRDKLIESDDEMLNTFLQNHPDVDRQQLRQLIRNAKLDKKNNKNTGGATALFRYLRAILEKK